MFGFMPVTYPDILSNKVQIKGNFKACDYIVQKTKNCISKGIALYQAQQIVIDMVKEKYGVNWYQDSADAVNFLIENEYCRDIREKQPYIDKRALADFYNSSVLY